MATSKSLTKIQIQGKTRRIPEIIFFHLVLLLASCAVFFVVVKITLSVVCDNSNQSTIQILVTNSSVNPFS